MKNVVEKILQNPVIVILTFLGFLGIFGPHFLVGFEVFSLGMILIMLTGDSKDGHVSINNKEV